MIQTLPKITTFQEFIDWLPENSDVRYELHHGNIVEMAQPVGEHEEIKGFLTIKLSGIIDRLDLPYLIPNQVIVRPDDKDSGYFPDVLVMNRANLPNESRWKKESIFSSGASIPLIIEVVSTNISTKPSNLSANFLLSTPKQIIPFTFSRTKAINSS